MRVLLISANTERTNMLPLPLGPACVAAACQRAGHETFLLNLMFEGDAEVAVRHCIEDFRPGVIGVSVRNIDDQNMAAPRFLLPPVREAVATCRRLTGAPIVLGGAGYSIFPEAALRYLEADIGVRGEGEAVFPAVVERLARGENAYGLLSVYAAGRPAPAGWSHACLDDLPLPDPDLWIPDAPATDQLWIPVQGKRGCPMGCSFCSTRLIEGTRIRKRYPEILAEWMERAAARGWRRFVLVDNTFNIPPSYAKGLCRAVIERRLDIDLWCIVHPKWVDGELVDLMAKAGCREISLGFESGSEPVLKRMNKRFTPAEARAVARMFANAGIARRGFLLLGGPGETMETVEETLAFADSLELDSLRATAGIRIYPGTVLAADALADDLISPDDDLLLPAFYLAPRLKDWLPERLATYKAARPWVT